MAHPCTRQRARAMLLPTTQQCFTLLLAVTLMLLTRSTIARQHVKRRKLSAGKRPKIYIYDLPEKYHNYTQHGDLTDQFYGLDQLFPWLLRDSPYVTNNTEEADYFFVDAWLYWGTASFSFGPGEVVQELQRIGPWWDRKKGADHIFVVTADTGRCQYNVYRDLLRNTIMIQHYGRLLGALSGIYGVCDISTRWGAECDEQMEAAEAALAQKPPLTCHYPGQDIVTPPACFEPQANKPHTLHYKTPYIDPELRVNRSDMLFYSGLIDINAERKDPKHYLAPWDDARYSHGARQTVYRMFSNLTGYALFDHHTHDDYWLRLARAKFCLATAGWGWGGRMKVAATRGCIPVIVQDGIKVEWEEQLPLQQYAIRVPLWMVHKLPQILNVFVDSGRVEKMQKALDCAWRLHWWRRPEGRAFELTMCELKRRVLGVAKINVDLEACTLDCGDGVAVPLREAYNNV